MRFTKVLVVNPPSPPGYISNKDSMGGFGQLFPAGATLLPPLDLPYLVGYLVDRGISVEVIEALGEDLTREQAVRRVADDAGPDRSKQVLVVVRTSAPTLDWDLSVCTLMKDTVQNIVLAIYGPVVSHVLKRLQKESCLDYILAGEPDETVHELAIGLPEEEVLGVTYRCGETWVASPPRPFLRELDRLPFPKWELLPYHRYTLPKSSTTAAVPFLPMLTSRGCPFGCHYCCRRTSDLAHMEGLPVERVIGDVTDLRSVRLAVRDQEWVIHAAANISSWGRDYAWQTTVNVEGTYHVAQACRLEGVRRLLHVSSVAAVGIPTDPQHPANEDFPFNLEDSGLSYHISKRRAEEKVLEEVARGLDAVIVNPASIFGPCSTRYRGAEMLQKVRRARIVPYFTGGICVVHVQDVVTGILVALEQGMRGSRYIFGGENLTYQALVERTAQGMHLRRRFVPVPSIMTRLAVKVCEPWGRLWNRRPRITYAVHYCASRYSFYDSSRARQTLAYEPRGFAAILDECLRLGAC